jgi:hypothetical protein
MTTIILDDDLVNQVISVSEQKNAQEAVAKILTDYLQQRKKSPSIIDLLAMPEVADIDFEPPKLATLTQPADFS